MKQMEVFVKLAGIMFIIGGIVDLMRISEHKPNLIFGIMFLLVGYVFFFYSEKISS